MPISSDDLRRLADMKQPGVFEYEANDNYASRKGSPIQPHVIRYTPHPRKMEDGRTSLGWTFPCVVASDLLGEPEETLVGFAEQLNAAPELAAEVLERRAQADRDRARIEALEGALREIANGATSYAEPGAAVISRAALANTASDNGVQHGRE